MARKTLTTLVLILGATAVQAGDEALPDQLLQPQFVFQHQKVTTTKKPVYDAFSPFQSQDSREQTLFDNSDPVKGGYRQYDATITYPLTRRDSVNLDLGVNLRFIEGDFATQQYQQGNQYITTAFPMLYANAMFQLPFEGLQASVGATHLEYEQFYAFDYKAKLSYSWSSGLGLEGGWQHQQFSIDTNDLQAGFEKKGPFLDFRYRF